MNDQESSRELKAGLVSHVWDSMLISDSLCSAKYEFEKLYSSAKSKLIKRGNKKLVINAVFEMSQIASFQFPLNMYI